MNARAIQFSFAWIFAMVIGAFIIFLAIYGSMKLMDTGSGATSIKVEREIGILLDPLQTSFGESTSNLLSLPTETRIHNRCSSSGNFGIQTISVSQKNFGEWTDAGIGSDFKNKYLFSEADVEGKEFFLFSKSFNLPFKVADLVYVTSSEDDYCFIDPSEDVSLELGELGQGNIFLENCPSGSINVCFDPSGTGDCDVVVRTGRKEVERGGEIVYFEGDSLMYAAIFSDPEIYECQVSRLMKRAGELLLIYDGKKSIVLGADCSVDVELGSFRNSVLGFKDSEDIFQLYSDAEDIDKRNNAGRCELW